MSRSNLPRGERAARKTFEGFHSRAAKNVTAFPASVKIPSEISVEGPCIWVTYRSDKWGKGTYEYIHEIDSYPKVKLGVVGGEGPIRRVPQRIQNVTTLSRIGACIGWAFADGDEELEAKVSGCEWFWAPAGKALIAIQNKRKVIAIIWGGELDVEDRGIVG